MRLTVASSGTSIRLGPEVGRGGEGAVFAIVEQSDRVAKIYSQPPDPSKVRKLEAMSGAATPSLLRIAAWPIDLALDSGRTPRGFIMPRISAQRDIHELYSPKSRAEAFPQADLRFLIHVAGNISRAFAVVHAHGHVIGDVNHGNVLVGPDGTVTLIDCDSFQVRNAAEVYSCDVGVPLFTAPELQGLAFRGLHRTANHDRFGLAVLLFHLLFMGRHPFAGRYAGAGDMPIDRAIREFRFAYGPDRALRGMQRPPGTILLESMGASVPPLFVTAFGRPATSTGRPEARAWIQALKELESSLSSCSRLASHQFPRQLAACPWCALEQQTGVRLFGRRIKVHSPAGVIDVGYLWKMIEAVPPPDQDPPLPSQQPWHQPADLAVRHAFKALRKAVAFAVLGTGVYSCTAFADEGGIIWALLAYVLAQATWPRPSQERLANAEQLLASARTNWQSLLARWAREGSREAFKAAVADLSQARADLLDLPNERQRCLSRLHAERDTRQRQRYLDRFHIDRARIRSIGPGRTTMLAAYGIETAADIEERKIRQIPGFGPALTADLLAWRRAHALNFRFNPNDPDHDRDVLSLDRDIEAKRQALLATLREGPGKLQRVREQIQSVRPQLTPLLERAWAELKLAEARRNAV